METSPPESPPAPSHSDRLLTEGIRVNSVTDTTYHGLRHSEEFIPVGELSHEPEQVTFEPELSPLQRFAGRLGLLHSVEASFDRSLDSIIGPASDRVRGAIGQGKVEKAERIKQEVKLYLRDALGIERPPEDEYKEVREQYDQQVKLYLKDVLGIVRPTDDEYKKAGDALGIERPPEDEYKEVREQYDIDTERLNKQKTEYFGRRYKAPRSYRIAQKLRLVPHSRPRLQRIAENLSAYDAPTYDTDKLDRDGEPPKRLTSPELERAKASSDRAAYKLELHRLIAESGRPTLAPVPRGKKPVLKVLDRRRPALQDIDNFMEARAKYNRTTLARVDEDFLTQEKEQLAKLAEREAGNDPIFTSPRNILALKMHIEQTIQMNIDESARRGVALSSDQMKRLRNELTSQIVSGYFESLQEGLDEEEEIVLSTRKQVHKMLRMSFEELAELSEADETMPEHSATTALSEASDPTYSAFLNTENIAYLDWAISEEIRARAHALMDVKGVSLLDDEDWEPLRDGTREEMIENYMAGNPVPLNIERIFRERLQAARDIREGNTKKTSR